MTAKLNVNVDHIATIRQARRAPEPSVVAAAMICELAGSDGITVHLRGDRRHIQDQDLYVLRQSLTTYLNVEMAATDEMVSIAREVKPDCVTLVAERPDEITTEGGLNVHTNISIVRSTVSRLHDAGIITSLFIDPTQEQVEAARKVGAQQIELCTAEYAELTLGARAAHGEGSLLVEKEINRLLEAAKLASQYGIRVAAGHGLTYRNIGALAAIKEIVEFNIGHNIISRAALVGLDKAVREMREAIALGEGVKG